MTMLNQSTNQPINKSTNPQINAKKFDIHGRIFDFVIAVLKNVKYIPISVEYKIICNQLIRAVTSVGANDQEADGVSSKADFIHCYTVVRKELKEVCYWLSILSELNSSLKLRFGKNILENQELIKIVSAIIKNAAIKRN